MTDRNKLAAASLASMAAITITGCCTPSKAPRIDVPVIDVHAHAFNVRDLPAQGILDAVAAQKGWNVSQRVTRTLAQVLYRWTPTLKDELRRGDDCPSPARTLTPMEREVLTETLTQEFQGWSPETGNEAGDLSDEELVAGLVYELDFLDDSEEMHALEESPAASLRGGLRLIGIATRSHQGVVERMEDTFGEQPSLYVHHMMDLERAYDDRPPVPFGEQIEFFEGLAERNPNLLHFVAFDPFRGESALANVIEAKKRGALGVKYYPPSGYRPTHNAVLPRKSSPAVLGRQWDSRYGALGDTPAAIDDEARRAERGALRLLRAPRYSDLPPLHPKGLRGRHGVRRAPLRPRVLGSGDTALPEAAHRLRPRRGVQELGRCRQVVAATRRPGSRRQEDLRAEGLRALHQLRERLRGLRLPRVR